MIEWCLPWHGNDTERDCGHLHLASLHLYHSLDASSLLNSPTFSCIALPPSCARSFSWSFWRLEGKQVFSRFSNLLVRSFSPHVFFVFVSFQRWVCINIMIWSSVRRSDLHLQTLRYGQSRLAWMVEVPRNNRCYLSVDYLDLGGLRLLTCHIDRHCLGELLWHVLSLVLLGLCWWNYAWPRRNPVRPMFMSSNERPTLNIPVSERLRVRHFSWISLWRHLSFRSWHSFWAYSLLHSNTPYQSWRS